MNLRFFCCSDELMIPGYIIRSDWRFRIVLASLGGIVELLPHDEQSAGQLLSVGAIVADRNGLVPLTHDELCNVHPVATSFTIDGLL